MTLVYYSCYNNQTSIQSQHYSKKVLNADFVSHLYRNTLKLLPFKWLRKSSKITQTSFDIAGILQKSPENHGKSSEVIGTLSTIPVMTRQKSHTCDSEEVGRYIAPTLLCTTPFNVKSFAAVLLVGGPLQLIFAIWATKKS